MARKTQSQSICAMDNCDDPATAKGLCGACYQWERYHAEQGHGISYFTGSYSKRIRRATGRMETTVGVKMHRSRSSKKKVR